MQNDLRKMRADRFLVTLWCYYKIWKQQPELATRHLPMPRQFIEGFKSGQNMILPWELEGLLGQYLRAYDNLTDSDLAIGRIDPLNHHNSVVMLNAYKQLVSAESLHDIDTSTEGLLQMFSRIAWQQFSWQVGHDHPFKMLRYCFLYYGPKCRSEFLRQTGVDAETFFTVCLALASLFNGNPSHQNTHHLEPIGITSGKMRQVLGMISRSPKQASKEIRLRSNRKEEKAEFCNNGTFDFPVLSVTTSGRVVYYCPFPELIVHRCTYGIYFDIINGERAKLEASKRLERYCIEFINSTCDPTQKAIGDFKYGPRKSATDSPDIMVVDGRSVSIAIECKARKIPHHVRASSRPFVDYPESYDEIAHGVYQTWRFRRDLAAGKVNDGQGDYFASANLATAVVTLEPWADISFLVAQKIVEKAKTLNNDHRGTARFVDEQYHVVPAIISIEELENALTQIEPLKLAAFLNSLAFNQNNVVAGGHDADEFKRKNPVRGNPVAHLVAEAIPLTLGMKAAFKANGLRGISQ
ncbi:hypothetical protein [Cereibacter changlensis]|uniref:hypothetical protein n=1 Tax=Cereibacter changlensis TaxID=402884 RepID=UPI00403395C6